MPFVARAFERRGLLPPDRPANNDVASSFTTDSSHLPLLVSFFLGDYGLPEWAIRGRFAKLPAYATAELSLERKPLGSAEEGMHPPWMHSTGVTCAHEVIELQKSEGMRAALRSARALLFNSSPEARCPGVWSSVSWITTTGSKSVTTSMQSSDVKIERCVNSTSSSRLHVSWRTSRTQDESLQR